VADQIAESKKLQAKQAEDRKKEAAKRIVDAKKAEER